jgi:small conductance mechanosensitive channel
MNANSLIQLAQLYVVPMVLKLLAAVIVWYIGRWAIRLGVNFMRKALTHNKLDATLIRYICSITGGVLTVFLALGVMSVVGIETTSFAAVAAGAGLAIGAAWSGMLGNFAAGVFMIVMQPFKVGDDIEAAGVKGKVKEIGLFSTEIDTEEKVHTLVGNGKLFEDKVSNFSANPVRVCSIQFSVPSGSAFRPRMELLKTALQGLEHVEPASAVVRIKGFNYGPVLEALTSCPHQYWEDLQGEMADVVEQHFGDIGFGGAPSSERGNSGEGGEGSRREAEGGEGREEEEG